MPTPAVFLDRDGTVIEERNYLADPAGVALLPGAVPAMARLREAGYLLVLITNQAGVARGYFDEDAVERVNAHLADLLEAGGVALDGVYFCPHHPEFTGPCACRKPGTALGEQAARELDLDLGRSHVVGDKLSDVRFGLDLGCGAFLVRTGHGPAAEAALPAELGEDAARVQVVPDLAAAAARILGG